MGVFPHLRPPRFFFQKSGSVTFVPLWCPNFMQKIRKNQWAVSEIFKDGRTDGPRTDQRTNGQGRLLRTPSGKPGVQNMCQILPVNTVNKGWGRYLWNFRILSNLNRRRNPGAYLDPLIHYMFWLFLTSSRLIWNHAYLVRVWGN